MSEIEEIKKRAIVRSLRARQKAILIKSSSTKVGACIYDVFGNMYEGFNIKTESHKSYHAEEIAALSYLIHRMDPKNALGIVVSFSAKDIKRLTFACGHCRQILWETFRSSKFLLIEVDLEENIIMEKTLGELYPYPYPRFDEEVK